MKYKFSIMILLILIISCQQDDTNIKEQISKFESVELKNPLIKEISLKYSKTKFLKGDFELLDIDNKIIISTDTEKLKHIFLFDKDGKTNFSLSEKIKNLYYLKDALILNKNVIIEVDKNSSKTLRENLASLADKKELKKFKTKNLTYLWVNKTDSLTTKEIISSINNSKHKREDCEAGGEGATGCSITSNSGAGCSTSCGSGYYACCNETLMGPNDCDCVELDSDEEITEAEQF